MYLRKEGNLFSSERLNVSVPAHLLVVLVRHLVLMSDRILDVALSLMAVTHNHCLFPHHLKAFESLLVP